MTINTTGREEEARSRIKRCFLEKILNIHVFRREKEREHVLVKVLGC